MNPITQASSSGTVPVHDNKRKRGDSSSDEGTAAAKMQKMQDGPVVIIRNLGLQLKNNLIALDQQLITDTIVIDLSDDDMAVAVPQTEEQQRWTELARLADTFTGKLLRWSQTGFIKNKIDSLIQILVEKPEGLFNGIEGLFLEGLAHLFSHQKLANQLNSLPDALRERFCTSFFQVFKNNLDFVPFRDVVQLVHPRSLLNDDDWFHEQLTRAISSCDLDIDSLATLLPYVNPSMKSAHNFTYQLSRLISIQSAYGPLPDSCEKFKGWTELRFGSYLTFDQLERIATIFGDTLTELDASLIKIVEHDFEVLNKFRNLTTLKTSTIKLTKLRLKFLKKLKTLEIDKFVILSKFEIPPLGWEKLVIRNPSTTANLFKATPFLKHLHMHFDNRTDFFDDLKELSQLENLSLILNSLYSHFDLCPILANGKSLKCLTLSNGAPIIISSNEAISLSIEELQLENDFKLDLKGNPFPNLKKLVVTTRSRNRDIENQRGWMDSNKPPLQEYLRNFKELKQLILHAELSDAGRLSLMELPNLQELTLSSLAGLSEDNLMEICRHPTLKVLTIHAKSIFDDQNHPLHNFAKQNGKTLIVKDQL